MLNNSASPLAQMTRIMLQFLLIPIFSGIILHASGEEQTVSAIAEKYSSTSEKSLPYSTSKLPTFESTTLSNTADIENGVDFLNSSTQSTHNSSETLKNTESTDYGKVNSRDTTAESTSSIKYSTGDSSGLKSTENSKVRSSDIDYGGYNSVTGENYIGGSSSTRKYLPGGSKSEFVPVESATLILGIEMTVEDKASSRVDESSASTVASLSTTLESGTSSPADVSLEKHAKDFISTTLKADDVSDVTTSFPSISPQKVSASPKGATKKRSLNSTNVSSVASTLMQTSPSLTVSDGTTSQSSKIDSFDTTTNTKPKLDVEELPSPLPLENQNEDATTLVTSTELPLIESIPDEKEYSVKGDISDNQTPSTTLLPNAVPTVSTVETGSNVNFKDGEDLAESTPRKEVEAMNLSSVSDTKIPTGTSSQTSPSEALPHEDDDIIFAGFADEPLGVTFDPDGMRNDFPQDPDSIIFSVPPKDVKMSTERYTDPQPNAEREMMEPLKPEIPYLDLDDLEFAIHKTENSSFVFDNSIPKSNYSEPLVIPEIIHYHPAIVLDGSDSMFQDAPHYETQGHSTKISQSDLKATTTPHETNMTLPSEFKITKDSSIEGTHKPVAESSSDYVFHHTDQSVIRPVKIISPTDKSASAVSSDTLLQSTEFYTTSSSGDLGSIDVQNANSNMSSPMVQTNPSQTTVEKPVEKSDVSTTVMQPSSNFDMNATLHYDNEEANPNSTIAGVAIKTSVSVSLPISKIVNGSLEALNSNASESSVPVKVFGPTSITNKDASESTLPDTSVDTTTNSPSTSAAPFKIRKPGIRVPGMSDATSVRTRKPYVPPALKRASTTAGPPVSIFKKSRTRINSITSSTTSKPFPQFSTIRIHYGSHLPGLRPTGEMIVSVEPITTTVPPTTTTEEPISEVPFTDQTYVPSLSSEGDVTLVKVGGGIVLKQGIRWTDQLGNRHSPEYKEKATQLLLHLEQLFRSSTIATQLWRIEIDGFNGTKISRGVEVDFILYLIKSPEMIAIEHLPRIFHEKLTPNNTFARYRVDPSKTAFEILQEEPLYKPTPSPEDEYEPPVPQWAIAVIVICAASLIFIVLFAAVTMYGRHHMRRRYGDKLKDDELDRSSGEWESKMTSAYENMAADTIYDAEDLPGDAYKKSCIMD